MIKSIEIHVFEDTDEIIDVVNYATPPKIHHRIIPDPIIPVKPCRSQTGKVKKENNPLNATQSSARNLGGSTIHETSRFGRKRGLKQEKSGSLSAGKDSRVKPVTRPPSEHNLPVWTEADDQRLIEAIRKAKYGNWVQVTKLVPGRLVNHCRTRGRHLAYTGKIPDAYLPVNVVKNIRKNFKPGLKVRSVQFLEAAPQSSSELSDVGIDENEVVEVTVKPTIEIGPEIVLYENETQVPVIEMPSAEASKVENAVEQKETQAGQVQTKGSAEAPSNASPKESTETAIEKDAKGSEAKPKLRRRTIATSAVATTVAPTKAKTPLSSGNRRSNRKSVRSQDVMDENQDPDTQEQPSRKRRKRNTISNIENNPASNV
jgi:hypothetical protein